MISLVKGDEPEILSSNGASWLKILEDKIAANEAPSDAEKTRYRHPEIKAALVEETYGKCAYCESRLLHIAFGDVEHISPKSLKLADTFRWSNLTLACDRCNTYKKNFEGIADPYVDDPQNLFLFLGPMICAREDNAKAVVTVRQLRLNRTDLVEGRTKRLEALANILLVIHSTRQTEVRSVLIDDLLENELADDTEYAAFARSFIRTIAPDLAPVGS